MTDIKITLADLRELMAAECERPALYVGHDGDGEFELVVGPNVDVHPDWVITTPDDLTDWIGDDWLHDAESAKAVREEYLPELQERIDSIVG